jgi:hypothetical protein
LKEYTHRTLENVESLRMDVTKDEDLRRIKGEPTYGRAKKK